MNPSPGALGHPDRASDAIPRGKATVFLLVGLTGSGKTTYAKRVLEPAGVLRLSVDEEVFSSFQVSHETPAHTHPLRGEAA